MGRKRNSVLMWPLWNVYTCAHTHAHDTCTHHTHMHTHVHMLLLMHALRLTHSVLLTNYIHTHVLTFGIYEEF